jgi:hypothetical protein
MLKSRACLVSGMLALAVALSLVVSIATASAAKTGASIRAAKTSLAAAGDPPYLLEPCSELLKGHFITEQGYIWICEYVEGLGWWYVLGPSTCPNVSSSRQFGREATRIVLRREVPATKVCG